MHIRQLFYLVFTIFLFVSACHGSHGHDHGSVAVDAQKAVAGELRLPDDEADALGIRTRKVLSRKISVPVLGAGELEPVPGSEVRLTAPARGIFLQVEGGRRPGQAVSRGEVLGRVALWTSEAQAELLQGEWNAAWTMWQNEKKQRERARQLFERGLESRERLEETETRATLAQGRVNDAWARIARMRKANAGKPDPTTLREIRCPIDGTLIEVAAGDGVAVEEGHQLFLVRDDRQLDLRVRIFDADLPRLGARPDGWFVTPGDDAPHPLPAPGGEPPVVLPGVDPATRTGVVLARVDNRAGKLRSGQWVRVHLRTTDTDEGPVLPRGAIVREGFHPVAYVRTQPGVYARRRVRTGAEDDTAIRILEGLAAGEEAVVENPQKLLYLGASALIPQSAHTH